MSTPRDTKICSAAEAVAQIASGRTLVCGGFVGAAHPESLTSALEKRFLDTGEPRGLTLVYAAGQGDGVKRGLNHLAHTGLLKRVIGGHWGLCPSLGAMANDGLIEAYNFPQGVICQLLRDIAADRPGCITHIGLGTFIDPEQGGGRLNRRTTEPLVERIDLNGRAWLWYKAMPIHVGLVRATAADPFGNLVMDDEAIIGEVLPIAQAAHNNGGTVIAQVKRLLDRPVSPQRVSVPGILVDRIVVADPVDHDQTFAESYNAGYCQPVPTTQAFHATAEPMAFGPRRIIASRACDELKPNAIANLGIGMPEGIARIAAERGLLEHVTLTVESGPIGGMPAGGLSFGAALHPQAIIDQPSQFDFYDGRGLDFAALGAAQIDRHGNVNVSRFGNRMPGVGGFVNISQTARRLVFCGTFTAGGVSIAYDGHALRIIKEGREHKFVERVEQVSFSAERSRQIGQEVLYVTERAVFQLTDDGLELLELAPGVDYDRDVRPHMAFEPIVRNVRLMPGQSFES